mgnify:CR=1 FL=1
MFELLPAEEHNVEHETPPMTSPYSPFINYEDDAEAAHCVSVEDFRVKKKRDGNEPELLQLLQMENIWRHGLRLIVSQPSSMWQEYRIEKV